MKIYAKLRGRLYANNFERKLTKIDRLFLGV